MVSHLQWIKGKQPRRPSSRGDVDELSATLPAAMAPGRAVGILFPWNSPVACTVGPPKTLAPPTSNSDG